LEQHVTARATSVGDALVHGAITTSACQLSQPTVSHHLK